MLTRYLGNSSVIGFSSGEEERGCQSTPSHSTDDWGYRPQTALLFWGLWLMCPEKTQGSCGNMVSFI